MANTIAALEAEGATRNVAVSDSSVRGNRAEIMWANRFQIPRDSQYVIWVGSNDLDREGAHPQVILSWILHLQRFLTERGAQAYVVMVPGRFRFRFRRATYSETLRRNKEMRNGLNRSLRRELRYKFISIPNNCFREEEYVDGIHLNSNLYRTVAVRVFRQISFDLVRQGLPPL